MKLQFDNSDFAWGFARGLGDADGLDLIADSDGCTVDVPGIEPDSEIGQDILKSAVAAGGVLLGLE